MWIEIHLLANITHVKDSNIVLDKCQRNNEGRKPVMIIADHAQQLGLFVGAEPFLEMSNNVLEHVHVLAYRCLHNKCTHKQFPIPVSEFFRARLVSLTDQPSEYLVLLRVMRHQQILVDRVELHQGLLRGSPPNKILPPAVTENPLNKILSDRWVTEPPFFLDRNQRKLLHKGPRKQSDSVKAGDPTLSVNTNSLDTATRRTLLKDIPGE